jgi:hypothetical protein
MEIISVTIPLMTGIWYFNQISVAFRWVTVMCGLSFLCEYFAYFFAVYFHSNLEVYIAYSLFSPAVLLLVYAHMSRVYTSKAEIILLCLLYLFFIVDALVIQPHEPLPTYIQQATALTAMLFALRYFRTLLRHSLDIKLTINSYFWLNTGVFLYYGLTLFYWGVFNLLLKKDADFEILIQWNLLVSTVFYAIITYSLFLNSKQNHG